LQNADDPSSVPATITSYWANHPSYYNHSELAYANELAEAAGYPEVPFPYVRPLPEDNGERFFSEYWAEEIERRSTYEGSALNDRCYCPKCGCNPVQLSFEVPPPQPEETETPMPVEEATSPSPAKPAQQTPSPAKEPTPPSPAKEPTPPSPAKEPTPPVKPMTPSPTKERTLAVPIAPRVSSRPQFCGGVNKKQSPLARVVRVPRVELKAPPQPSYHPPPPMMAPPVMQPMMMYPFAPFPFQPFANVFAYPSHMFPVPEQTTQKPKRTKRPKAQQQDCGCEEFRKWVHNPNRNSRPKHDKGCPARTTID
jgi:hypothetical protein